MPEGPEIRRAALRIDKVLSGRQAEIVSFGQPHLQHFGQHLSGEQIEWVSSRGKAMLTRFANGLTPIQPQPTLWPLVCGSAQSTAAYPPDLASRDSH